MTKPKKTATAQAVAKPIVATVQKAAKSPASLFNKYDIQDDIAALNTRFVHKLGELATINREFRTVYLPSAISHALTTGNIGAINNVLQAVNNMRGLAKFKALLAKVSCHKFDTAKGKFAGKKDHKKHAKLIKIDPVFGVPKWLVILDTFLKNEDNQEKAAARTFNDKLLSAARTLKRLNDEAESEEQAEMLAPFINNVVSLCDRLEAEKAAAAAAAKAEKAAATA